MGKNYTYFTIAIFYLTVLTDIIAMAFLGAEDSAKGELGIMITLFLIERCITIMYRFIK